MNVNSSVALSNFVLKIDILPYLDRIIKAYSGIHEREKIKNDFFKRLMGIFGLSNINQKKIRFKCNPNNCDFFYIPRVFDKFGMKSLYYANGKLITTGQTGGEGYKYIVAYTELRTFKPCSLFKYPSADAQSTNNILIPKFVESYLFSERNYGNDFNSLINSNDENIGLILFFLFSFKLCQESDEKYNYDYTQTNFHGEAARIDRVFSGFVFENGRRLDIGRTEEDLRKEIEVEGLTFIPSSTEGNTKYKIINVINYVINIFNIDYYTKKCLQEFTEIFADLPELKFILHHIESRNIFIFKYSSIEYIIITDQIKRELLEAPEKIFVHFDEDKEGFSKIQKSEFIKLIQKYKIFKSEKEEQELIRFQEEEQERIRFEEQKQLNSKIKKKLDECVKITKEYKEQHLPGYDFDQLHSCLKRKFQIYDNLMKLLIDNELNYRIFTEPSRETFIIPNYRIDELENGQSVIRMFRIETKTQTEAEGYLIIINKNEFFKKLLNLKNNFEKDCAIEETEKIFKIFQESSLLFLQKIKEILSDLKKNINIEIIYKNIQNDNIFKTIFGIINILKTNESYTQQNNFNINLFIISFDEEVITILSTNKENDLIFLLPQLKKINNDSLIYLIEEELEKSKSKKPLIQQDVQGKKTVNKQALYKFFEDTLKERIEEIIKAEAEFKINRFRVTFNTLDDTKYIVVNNDKDKIKISCYSGDNLKSYLKEFEISNILPYRDDRTDILVSINKIIVTINGENYILTFISETESENELNRFLEKVNDKQSSQNSIIINYTQEYFNSVLDQINKSEEISSLDKNLQICEIAIHEYNKLNNFKTFIKFLQGEEYNSEIKRFRYFNDLEIEYFLKDSSITNIKKKLLNKDLKLIEKKKLLLELIAQLDVLDTQIEECKEAKRTADEEARIKTEEEAKRTADEEAKRIANEEARIKAEEEDRIKADEEAQRIANEEARIKAEKEAQIKADEEAQKLAKQKKLIQFILDKIKLFEQLKLEDYLSSIGIIKENIHYLYLDELEDIQEKIERLEGFKEFLKKEFTDEDPYIKFIVPPSKEENYFPLRDKPSVNFFVLYSPDKSNETYSSKNRFLILKILTTDNEFDYTRNNYIISFGDILSMLENHSDKIIYNNLLYLLDSENDSSSENNELFVDIISYIFFNEEFVKFKELIMEIIEIIITNMEKQRLATAPSGEDESRESAEAEWSAIKDVIHEHIITKTYKGDYRSPLLQNNEKYYINQLASDFLHHDYYIYKKSVKGGILYYEYNIDIKDKEISEKILATDDLYLPLFLFNENKEDCESGDNPEEFEKYNKKQTIDYFKNSILFFYKIPESESIVKQFNKFYQKFVIGRIDGFENYLNNKIMPKITDNRTIVFPLDILHPDKHFIKIEKNQETKWTVTIFIQNRTFIYKFDITAKKLKDFVCALYLDIYFIDLLIENINIFFEISEKKSDEMSNDQIKIFLQEKYEKDASEINKLFSIFNKLMADEESEDSSSSAYEELKCYRIIKECLPNELHSDKYENFYEFIELFMKNFCERKKRYQIIVYIILRYLMKRPLVNNNYEFQVKGVDIAQMPRDPILHVNVNSSEHNEPETSGQGNTSASDKPLGQGITSGSDDDSDLSDSSDD